MATLRFSERELLERARQGKPMAPDHAIVVLERLERIRGALTLLRNSNSRGVKLIADKALASSRRDEGGENG